ncbi:HNH endonuclease [Bradyrhizobium elkanii]|uniref:HNH nuclease domain-containing protein n=1 Tax=Bradyrhizobium elkanii TaxID=29448 RepID=A0A8I2C3I3_BRAEL|nr:HNH endonuclease [Bradyrhizobium elkanii]MBP1296630.1 hypothetical protein [Bradyrhizobium elkanii]
MKAAKIECREIHAGAGARERRRQPQTIEELLAPDRVWVTPCGCWLWLGGDDGRNDADGLGGYGRILRDDGSRIVEPVHRYVFKKFKGPIPPGYDVDHICAKWQPDPRVSRKCVNLDHLQAIPPRLNQQLKLLRRLGYGTAELDLDGRPHRAVPPVAPASEPPLFLPGESWEDLCF